MAYGGVRNGNTYADGYFGYTKNWHKTRRDIFIGDTFHENARSRYNDDMFSTGVELGRTLQLRAAGVSPPVSVSPSIGLHYIHLSTPSVTETGAGDARLFVHANRYNSLRMPIGAKLSRDIFSNGGGIFGSIIWTPEVRAYYVREFADASARTMTSFNNVRAVSFAAESGNWGRNSGRFGVGLNAALTDRLNL